ncbi:RNA polymerase sigma factor [Paenibacillus aurantiacus]|uniref:RNA polymerase sigma factor n=1 Tax=Paenibacillus aurantiacus TaxID=1936118 RepID=A0ABV5KWC2_9BACL
MRERSDYELMQLIKDREHQALSILYDRYAPLVYSFAFKALKDEQASRDIVQSVFMRLWSTGSEYDPAKGRYTSWLLTITRNMTTDWIRKHRLETSARQPVPWEQLQQLPDRQSPSPEDSYERGLLQAQVRDAYQYLTSQQIMLVEHFYWQGYSLSELAAMYDQPLGTVKNRLHQALKILRRHLTAEGEVSR